MADIFYQPKSRIISNDGSEVGAGYKFYFYQTLTDTPITTYSNPGLSNANSNPVLADAYGYLTPIYVSDFSLVKVVVKDADDNLIYTVDPVNPAGSSSITLNDLGVRPTSYWGVTTGTSSAYTMVANPTVPSYSNVQTFIFQCHLANAANPTLDIDGLGALNLKKYTGQGTKVGLQAGDMQATQRYLACNDGVDIIILNPRNANIYTGSAPTLTIATGVITIPNSGSAYTVDTEASSASDDLDTINGGALGEIIILQIADDARNVVVKNGTGNISNPSGVDITLDTTDERAILQYNGTDWIVLSNTTQGNNPLVLIRTQTASNSTSIDFNNLSSAFSKYILECISIKSATDGVTANLRVSTDNGANFASGGTDYQYTWENSNTFGLVTASSILLNDTTSGRTIGNAAGEYFNATINIFDPSNASAFCLFGIDCHYSAANGNSAFSYGTGRYQTATSINAIRFLFSSGNITSGTFKLYGVV